MRLLSPQFGGRHAGFLHGFTHCIGAQRIIAATRFARLSGTADRFAARRLFRLFRTRSSPRPDRREGRPQTPICDNLGQLPSPLPDLPHCLARYALPVLRCNFVAIFTEFFSQYLPQQPEPTNPRRPIRCYNRTNRRSFTPATNGARLSSRKWRDKNQIRPPQSAKTGSGSRI